MDQKPAAIYCRISQDREGRELGVDRQEQDCRELADRHGLTVSRVYVDNDTSASTRSTKARPAYDEMLEQGRAGRIGTVLAYSNSRLTRRVREYMDLIDLHNHHGVTIRTVVSGDHDLSTADGRGAALTVAVWDQAEAERTAERVKRGMREGVKAGRFMGGVPPFGWKYRLESHTDQDGTARERKLPVLDDQGRPVQDPAEAEFVRDATARFLAGESIGSLVRWANTTGLLTRTGKQWKHTPLRQLLMRPRNAGLATYEGEVVGPSRFPALVPEDDWRAVVAALSDPDRLTQSSARVKYLLSGIGLCGVCGERLRTARVENRSGTKRTIYKCAGPVVKGHPHRSQAPIDDYVSAVIVARLERDDAAALFAVDNTAEVDKLRAERTAVRDRLNALAVEFASGNITASQMGTASKRLQAQERDVTDRLTSLVSTSPIGDMVREDVPAAEWWEGLSVEKRRAVVDALCTVRVDVVGRGRARTFHPDSVRIEWKATA